MVEPAVSVRRADLDGYLARAENKILPSRESAMAPSLPTSPDRPLHVGVDLGTAYLVLVVLDEKREVLAGEYQFAQVVRDGLVLDFVGAVDRLKAMKAQVERRLGRALTHSASGYPPGVPDAEVRVIANVVQEAGMTCSHLVNEPSAANQILEIQDGAIVDVGGGTTGIAIVENGEVVYTADEPTGGTHFSLVIAGARDISFEEAEALKIAPEEQGRLFPLVRPVMEKVGTIISRHLADRAVDQITLVGGATAFPGFARVVSEYTGLRAWVPSRPLFITPLGIALHDGDGS